MTEPFNPLAIESLAHSIVRRMLEDTATPLSDVGLFTGAGVYAIYYRGEFGAYSELSTQPEPGTPIYVGKAIPRGSRRGLTSNTGIGSRALSSRLREHAASIYAAQNLAIEDFSARWLVIEEIWIALGESALIREHRPVWNAVVDGFGNHDPGTGRTNGVRSRWDTLHPGRGWAPNFPPRPETPSAIEQEIREYLRSRY